MSELPDIEVARYALRTFGIDDYGGKLMPVAVPMPDAWKDGTCQAVCIPGYSTWATMDEGEHTPASETCTCGIYGCHTISELRNQYYWKCRRIVAVIAAEGSTIIGNTGLRTQAARIVAYWTHDPVVHDICTKTCRGATHYLDINDMLIAYGFEPEPKVDLAVEAPEHDAVTTTINNIMSAIRAIIGLGVDI